MGHKAVDVIGRQSVEFEHIQSGLRHLFDGVFIDLAAFHFQVLLPGIEHFAGHGIARAAAGRPKQRRQGTVRAEQTGHDSALSSFRLQNHGAGAVAEQHTGTAIRPVQKRAHFFGTDDQRGINRSGCNLVLRGFQCIERTGTGGAEIVAVGVLGPDFFLHKTGGAGKKHVGGQGGNHQQIDILRTDARIGQRRVGGFGGEIRRGLILACDAPLAHAGTCENPFVIGINNGLQIGVGHRFFRKINAGSDNRNRPQTV